LDLNKHRIFIIYSLLIFSCNNITSNSKVINYESFRSEGITKTGSYTFCSIVPIEKEYLYRVGIWTFKSTYGHKIAEGMYENSINIIEDHGGCPYSYKTSTINLKNWKFWNEKGEIIVSTQKMINLIDPNQMNSENPFD
jgi:hypothetical protein